MSKPRTLQVVEIPSGRFDLAIVAHVTHLETPEGNRDLLRRARAALRPGGRVAVIDVFPGNPAGDLNRTLYALGLALRTRVGRVHGRGEISSATPVSVPPACAPSTCRPSRSPRWWRRPRRVGTAPPSSAGCPGCRAGRGSHGSHSAAGFRASDPAPSRG